MKQKERTERVVTLNNKSRRGQYLYIKEPYAKGRYYKLKEGEDQEVYKQYYTDKYKKGRKIKGTLQAYKKAYKPKERKTWKNYKISAALKRQAQDYLRKIAKRPSISEAFKKGLTQVTIDNILTASKKAIEQAHKQLLQDLIIDYKLEELVLKEENLKKIKQRFENQIKIVKSDGNTITANKYNTTPREVINEIQHEFRIGQEIDYPEEKLKKLGYQIEGKTDKTTIRKISLTITFRKAQ